ncbi:MAG TPA: response regulator [Pseudolabrys sp.]|nr:response regulator [Pseudolabrys sp.]
MSGEPGEQRQLLKGKHCLVLEDEFLIVLDIEETLQSLGAAAVVCANAVAPALAALDGAATFDFAVLDFKLNEETSEPVARALHARGIPYVFITGLIKAAQPGDEFAHVPTVTKPYDQPSLIAAFARALKNR